MATDGVLRLPVLPDEVVERILAKVQFPSVFKARVFSKSWLARFSPISTQDDEVTKKLVISFQKLLLEQSVNWKTFCPVCIGSEGRCTVFDSRSEAWRGMPSLNFLPENIHDRGSILDIEGALFLIGNRQEDGSKRYHRLYVANILTRTWTRLPAPPDSGSNRCWVWKEKLIIHPISETYQVILLLVEFPHYFAKIYDSKSQAWIVNKFRPPDEIRYSPKGFRTVYRDGIFYMAGASIWAIDINRGTVEHVCSLEGLRLLGERFKVVVSNNRLLLVMFGVTEDYVRVLEVDVESQQLLEVADFALELNLPILNLDPVSDGESIFIGVDDAQSLDARVLAYNMVEDKWSCSPLPTNLNKLSFVDECISAWCDSSFRPGLNPFMEVNSGS